jgi:hypothetical protein
MPRKYDKRWLVEEISRLRGFGLTYRRISQAVGTSHSWVKELARQFGIQTQRFERTHTPVDKQESILSNQTAGDVRPEET